MPSMIDDPIETRFIERLRAHDERAFNELVRLYEKRVFSLLLRMVGHRDEAEDLAQEVFVQVFKAIGSFRGDAKLSTWVFRIAINLSKNRTKYLARRRADSRDDIDTMGDNDHAIVGEGRTSASMHRPDDLVSGHQLETIVERAIGSLEAEFREVLLLRDIEDMAYDDIAEITGLPEGTVKSRIHRARLQLKAAVEEATGEKIR